ncbi:hypothetical protein FLSA109164_04485 [Flavobacterium saliperosum]
MSKINDLLVILALQRNTFAPLKNNTLWDLTGKKF